MGLLEDIRDSKNFLSPFEHTTYEYSTLSEATEALVLARRFWPSAFIVPYLSNEGMAFLVWTDHTGSAYFEIYCLDSGFFESSNPFDIAAEVINIVEKRAEEEGSLDPLDMTEGLSFWDLILDGSFDAEK